MDLNKENVRTWTACIWLVQGREKWQGLVKILMALCTPHNDGKFLTSSRSTNFSRLALPHG